jgi:hypothetical protein
MIIFVGDWVRMHLESKWHQVVDIKAFDIVVLNDGREVYAEDRPARLLSILVIMSTSNLLPNGA